MDAYWISVLRNMLKLLLGRMEKLNGPMSRGLWRRMQHAFAHCSHPSQSSSASHFREPYLRTHGLSAGPGVFPSALVSLVAYFRHWTISATALSLAWLRKCIIWLLRRLRQEPDQHCIPISSKLKPSLLETPKMQKDKGRVCRQEA